MTNGPIRASDLAPPTREEVDQYRADLEAEKAAKKAAKDAQRAVRRSALTDDGKAAIVADRNRGIPYKQIAKAHGVSDTTVRKIVNAAVEPEIPGMPLVTPGTLKMLGPGAIDWARANPGAVLAIKDDLDDAGQDLSYTGTAILLALAVEAHDALTAQTGGEPPTVRTALYWLMAKVGLTKAAYEPLVNYTADARRNDVLDRDFWADSEPSTIMAPAWYTLAQVIGSRFRDFAPPSDPLARTGHVFGCVTETRGAVAAMTGAIRQHLGFEIPVWGTGGMGSLPRRLHIERQMLEWAERTGCEPHLLTITDYDPSGVIIANAVDDEVRGIDVRRIGMLPDQAPNAALTSTGIKEPSDDDTHRKSKLWLDAVDEYGEDEFQAEAVDYAGWADHVADAIGEHIDLDDAYDEPGDEWEDGNRLMAALREVLDASGDDPTDMLDKLAL
jgi:hypothetical protein